MSDVREHKAFEILVRENSRMLLAYLSSAVDQQHVIDDLFQETMVVAWKKLDDCDLSRPFGPWLRGIAARLVMAHYRKTKSAPVALDDMILQQIGRQYESIEFIEGDSWSEKVSALRECIDALPEKNRSAIQGRYFDELKASPLAEQLRISVEACWKRLARSRGMIANCLKRKGVLVDCEATS